MNTQKALEHVEDLLFVAELEGAASSEDYEAVDVLSTAIEERTMSDLNETALTQMADVLIKYKGSIWILEQTHRHLARKIEDNVETGIYWDAVDEANAVRDAIITLS